MHELHIFAFSCSVADALVVPLGQTERAIVLLLHPVGDAVEVERMVTDAPRYGALVFARLIRLTLDARVHDVVAANGTVVDMNIPRPECNRVPFLHFEDSLLRHVRYGSIRSRGTCHVRINLVCVHFV